MQLGPSETRQLQFTIALADNAETALQIYDNLQSNFETVEKESEAVFNSLVRSAFTPGNAEFSRNLPRLVTEDIAVAALP